MNASTALAAHGISRRARGEPRGNRTGRDPACTALSLHGGDGHHALAETPVQRALDELLHGWSVYELDLGTFAQTARVHGRAPLRLDGRLFELELEPVDLRADGFREAWIGAGGQVTEGLSPVGTFAGQVVGEPDSEVRVLILPDLLQGYIRTAESWLFLDPMVRFSAGNGWPVEEHQVVLDEEADVRPGQALRCGTDALGHAASGLGISRNDLRAVTGAASTGDVWEAEVATEADFEYHQIYGSNTNSQIAGILNQVDGIFDDELDLKLKISFQSVWTTSSDPYDTTDSAERLRELRDYWNAHRSDVDRDLAHLFTGVDLDGSVIGHAFLGVVCNDPSNAYGISQDYFLMVKLISHEIGHNFDARHDDELSPPTATCDGTGPIMCSVIQSSGPNEFSNRSESDVDSHVSSNSSCLTRIKREPTACFSQSSSGSFYSFDASCSFDPNGSVVSYHWDFGDGSTGSGESVDHFYDEGTFQVTLTVTDDDGETDTDIDLVSNCSNPFEVFCTEGEL